jgi:hypothetical protein
VRSGGVRAVVAESLLLKQQLLISSRARRRAPNLNSFDRLLLGLGSLFVPPSRIAKLAVILKPKTLFRFHAALKIRKYRWLFSSGGHRRPGPKGPSKEIIDAIVAFKRRNPRIVGRPATRHHRDQRDPGDRRPPAGDACQDGRRARFGAGEAGGQHPPAEMTHQRPSWWSPCLLAAAATTGSQAHGSPGISRQRGRTPWRRTPAPSTNAAYALHAVHAGMRLRSPIWSRERKSLMTPHHVLTHQFVASSHERGHVQPQSSARRRPRGAAYWHLAPASRSVRCHFCGCLKYCKSGGG